MYSRGKQAEPGVGMHGILDPMVNGSQGGSGIAYWIAPDIAVSACRWERLRSPDPLRDLITINGRSDG